MYIICILYVYYMYIICILYVYYMYYICKKHKYAGFCFVFLFFFLRPQRFLLKIKRFLGFSLFFLRPQRFLRKSSGFSLVLRSALNRVLIPAQECRGKTVQNRTGIMDLQNKNSILVAKQISYIILVPMSYIGLG